MGVEPGSPKEFLPFLVRLWNWGYEIHSWKVMLWESEKRDLGAWT